MQRFVVLFCFLYICLCNTYSQQEYLNVRITYNAQNVPLEKALKDIEKQTSIRFTFNSAIINENEKITISIQNKTLKEVLPLLLKTKYDYKLIGNQILIYESPQKNIISNPSTKSNSPKTTKIKIDTVKIYDTITTIQIDTIHRTIYDTIHFYDTIKKNVDTDNQHFENKLSLSLLTGQFIAFPITTNAVSTKYKELISASNHVNWSSSQTFRATYNKKNFLVGVGIKYLPITYENKYNSTTIIDDSSHFFTDTLWYWKYSKLFTYYKYNETGDSVAITVYDSTYTYNLVDNPKKIEKTTTINSTISIRYISIPFSIGYEFKLNNSISFSPLFSLYTQIVLMRKGYVNDINDNIINIQELPIRHINYGLGFSCLSAYSINKKLSINVNPFIIIQPNIYKKSNIFQQTFASFGIEWGITYSFPYDLF